MGGGDVRELRWKFEGLEDDWARYRKCFEGQGGNLGIRKDLECVLSGLMGWHSLSMVETCYSRQSAPLNPNNASGQARATHVIDVNAH